MKKGGGLICKDNAKESLHICGDSFVFISVFNLEK